MLPPIFSSSILQGFLHDGFAVLPSGHVRSWQKGDCWMERRTLIGGLLLSSGIIGVRWPVAARGRRDSAANEEAMRSDEHTSELKSLMRNSYAVLCLK